MNRIKRAAKVIQAVTAALLGVQSEKNADTDFSSSSAKSYIIVGIIFVLLLITLLLTIVKMVT